MELTTLDPLGAFYLVALDTDWALRPYNINPDGSIRPRPVFAMPLTYPTNAAAGRIGAYTIDYQKFDQQQRVKSDLHSAICKSGIHHSQWHQLEAPIRHRISFSSRSRERIKSNVRQHH